MTTPRGKLWFSKRREALKLGVEHQGSDAKHQKADINHQKVGVGVTASTFDFLDHQKSRGDIMKRISFIASKKHQSVAFRVLML